MADFSNQATLRYDGSVLYSNVVTGTIASALTVQKIATAEGYTPGQDLSYAIGMVNQSTAPLTDLTVTDDLGAVEQGMQTLYPLTYVEGSVRLFLNGELQPAPTVAGRQPLQFTGISIPAGGSAVLLYEAIPGQFASPQAGSEIVNTVMVTADGLPTPAEASAVVTVQTAPVLSITKSLTPNTVPAQGQINYGFTLRNSGNAAAEGLIVEDSFAPILHDLTVRYNGAVWTEGVNYSYDEMTGEFATLPGQIGLEAAEFTQDASGVWSAVPAEAVLTVSGTI